MYLYLLRSLIIATILSSYNAAIVKATLVFQSMSQNNILSERSQNFRINTIEHKINAIQTFVDTLTQNQMQQTNNSKAQHSKFSNKKTNFNHRPKFRCGHRFQNHNKFSQQQNRFFKKKHNHDKQDNASSQSTSSAAPCQFCLCFRYTAGDCAFALFICTTNNSNNHPCPPHQL